jgi:hypothetical protein
MPNLLEKQTNVADAARLPADSGCSTRGFLSDIVYLLRHALPTLIFSIRAQLNRSGSQSDPQSILVTRLDGIGDFIPLSPFLRELRRATINIRGRVDREEPA